MLGRIIRTVAVVGIAGLLLALIIFNITNKPPVADQVWDLRTTLGNAETATRHYIMYTDVMCPYCDVFSRLMMENEEEFKRDYLEGKNVLFEVRMTDFLYEYGAHQTIYSRQGAEAIYCATEQNKFWDYYHAALQQLWDDYHSKGIGTSKTAPEISGIDDEYWLAIGRTVEAGAEFEECYNSHAMASKVEENTAHAARVVGGGVPYFQFEKFTNGGFDQSWGWDYVRRYLDAGL